MQEIQEQTNFKCEVWGTDEEIKEFRDVLKFMDVLPQTFSKGYVKFVTDEPATFYQLAKVRKLQFEAKQL